MRSLGDPERCRAVARSGVMSAAPAEAFDRAARLAARLLAAPVATVSFFDAAGVALRGAVGHPLHERPPTESLCRRVVEQRVPFVIADSRAHPASAEDEALHRAGVSAYCGVPISDGEHVLGTLAVSDRHPRRWSGDELRVLDDLAAALRTELLLRSANHELDHARREEQGILRKTFDEAPIGIALVGLDGSWLRVNRSLCSILGRSESDLLAHTFQEITHPEDLDTDLELFERVIAAEQLGYRIDKRYVRPDGEVVWADLSVALVHDDDGRPLHFVSQIQDITPRVERERQRRRIEEQLRVTVDHAPIGVALVDLGADARGRLLTVNRPFADLIGDPDPVSAGVNLLAPIHPDDAAALERDLTLLACDEQARIQLEVRCLHSDGRIGWLLLAGATVPGEEGARQAVIHAMDIGERKRFEGQLQYLADHDVLTGLFNRRRFESELDREVARAQRYGQAGAVMVIDLDGFKFVNDTMGHSRGDELVTRIGQLLRSVLRRTDVIARFGGDEFAVIVHEADDAQARAVAEKILDTLRQRAVILSENRHARVTASIGVTTFDSATALTAEELLVEADIAMYEAKELGKNQVVLYERAEDRRGTLSLRQTWLERLRLGLEEDRFELLAQPIRGICAHGVDRFELLLRLRGDDDELIPPGTFLYNAERFGLIGQIDRWVFGEALRLLAGYHAVGRDIALSVNMSGRTLVDPELLEDLSAMVGRCPVPPDRLIVEVTETAAIVNIDRARRVARGLRELGCRFALDDFGAGFASFYYLKHLEFDFLKIDGEFVKTLTTSPTDELVVKSVVDIARGLGAQTVAEFVGDDATVERLRDLGVDYGQGFHLGRPAPLSELLPALT